MKKIDAHIHFRPEDSYFCNIATSAGHENSVVHLKETFDALDIKHGIVMGNRSLTLENHNYPDFLSYCVGLDTRVFSPETLEETIQLVAQHLQRKNCVGIKIYAGYCCYYLTDPIYRPFYQLAQEYEKPIAVHTGVTASSGALLKYSHPLLLDEIAVSYPDITFIMCHMGNPWLADAAAVLEKNENVVADLSGLLEGCIDFPVYLKRQAGYMEQLKTWIAYVDDKQKFLYGTDWPLVNQQDYVHFISHIIPEDYHEAIFFENAKRVYQLML